MQRTPIPSLVRELRSYMLWGSEAREPQLLSHCNKISRVSQLRPDTAR